MGGLTSVIRLPIPRVRWETAANSFCSWSLFASFAYGSWRPLGKAFNRRIYLLYTNSHRQLLLISNRLWAFLLLEWPFPRRILLTGLEPLRINWKGSDNGRHAKPALVEVGPIEVGTIRSLSQSANSQSDKHNKASPTTTYSFHRFPLILLPLGLGAREGLQRPKKVLGLSLYQYFGSWWKLHKQIHPIAALAEAINFYKRKARGFFYLQWWSYSWWS
jgi:hypothetical protein